MGGLNRLVYCELDSVLVVVAWYGGAVPRARLSVLYVSKYIQRGTLVVACTVCLPADNFRRASS
jgi:hypothetical protein